MPKIVFDFTAARLSENVKIRPQWIYDFCLQQRCNRNILAANIGPCNLKLVLEQYFELWPVRYIHPLKGKGDQYSFGIS